MWTWKGIEFTSEMIQYLDSDKEKEYTGFVYLITNTTNNRKYIGQKIFKFKKYKTVKKKKKKISVESDWKDYYGSNTELNLDVDKLGKDNFTREILYLCKNKSMMNYLEAKEIFLQGALESNLFYNSWISTRINKSTIINLYDK